MTALTRRNFCLTASSLLLRPAHGAPSANDNAILLSAAQAANPTFALGGISHWQALCFQWRARLGLHYILSRGMVQRERQPGVEEAGWGG
jgi:hypothetical protein